MEQKEDRLLQVKKLADELGYLGAAQKLGIKKETVRRYCRMFKNKEEKQGPNINEKLARQIFDRFSESEIKRILSSGQTIQAPDTVCHDFSGDEVCFGILSDTHIGSVYTNPDNIYEAFERFADAGVDFIGVAGDVHEGLSNRAGHVYECSHVGYSQQLELSREIFSQWKDTPVYMIDGNHDRWFIKNTGAYIVNELCKSQDNLHFIGHDEGNIDINGVTIKLWHGEDGSSYAYSYRVQKIVESLTGGEKPNVLITGHTHKAFTMFCRHVHCVSAGAIQRQSKWMRSKKHESHAGFWIIRMTLNELGVARFLPEWFPFYI